MRRVGAVSLVGAVLVTAGCGGETAQDGPTGTVHGLIMQTGGPPGAGAVSAGGTVVLSRGGHEVRRQDVAAGQQYSFSVVAGSYVLTVEGVQGACGPEKVTVAADADTTRDLICARK